MKNAFITGANVGKAKMLGKEVSRQGWGVIAGGLPGQPTAMKGGGKCNGV